MLAEKQADADGLLNEQRGKKPPNEKEVSMPAGAPDVAKAL